jgi:hypothetical protein
MDIFEHFAYGLHRTISDLPNEAMHWQPDAEANNIAVTTWHICRALDVLKVRIIENKPDQNQLWYAMDWAEKTGYEPSGLGFGGFGNLAAYTLDQVKAVPLFSAEDSLAYFDQVYEALRDYLNNVTIETLLEPPTGWPSFGGAPSPDRVYDVILMFLMDNREHLGEIKAIKAMWNRAREKSVGK